ncbi:MAG: hypothetical protein JKY60_08275 [Kordiimonadaceae bacterium]|nr:hypothetical protein [Kordiimonadaceae bacterium]
MRELKADQLMALMEAGAGRSDIDRAQLMLAWRYPERDWQDIAELPVGKRDAQLLFLRQELFGDKSKLRCRCPQCEAMFEFYVDIPEILSADCAPKSRATEIGVETGGYHFRLRALDGRDLASLPNHLSNEDAVRFLAVRVILSVQDADGQPVENPAAGDISEEWIKVLSSALGDADPLSVVAFGVKCADCNNTWRAFFDAGHLLWGELEAENRAALEEIHLLAKNYGWREADIVAIPQQRRRFYAGKLSEHING